MASSRDDFIIAIRSAFLKKSTQQKFSLLTLVSISIFVIVLSSLDFKVIRYLKIGISELVYRSSFVVSIPENFIKNTVKLALNEDLYPSGDITSDLINEAISAVFNDVPDTCLPSLVKTCTLLANEDAAVNIFNFSEERESAIPFDANIKAPLVSSPTDLPTPTNNVFVDFEFDTTEDLFFMKMAGS